jgi:hypothetical protein
VEGDVVRDRSLFLFIFDQSAAEKEQSVFVWEFYHHHD